MIGINRIPIPLFRVRVLAGAFVHSKAIAKGLVANVAGPFQGPIPSASIIFMEVGHSPLWQDAGAGIIFPVEIFFREAAYS